MQLNNITKSSQKLSSTAATLVGKIDKEGQGRRNQIIEESFGHVSVKAELNELRSGIQDDLKTIQSRYNELVQNWATIRTGMKRRKEVIVVLL